MRPADLLRMVTLAALWGGSYLFMRFAVPHVGVEWVVEGRTLAGGAVLAAFIVLTRRDFALARHWRGYAVVGLLGVAVPFWLIGTAVKTIDASTAAILNSTSPIFSAIVASIWIRERLTLEKIAGIALFDRGDRDPGGLDAETDAGVGVVRLRPVPFRPAPVPAG